MGERWGGDIRGWMSNMGEMVAVVVVLVVVVVVEEEESGGAVVVVEERCSGRGGGGLQSYRWSSADVIWTESHPGDGACK